MLLDSVAITLIKNALNYFIQDDTDSQRRLLRLNGKVLKVHLTDVDKQLVFFFGQEVDIKIDVLDQADCSLSLSTFTVAKLRDRSNLTALINEKKLQLDGDIEVAQNFSSLIDGLNPDFTEKLSHFTGDVIAHSVTETATKGVRKFKELAEQKQRYLAEVLVEEWRLAPGSLEVAHFADRVDDIKSQVERLEQRLQYFDEQVQTYMSNKDKS